MNVFLYGLLVGGGTVVAIMVIGYFVLILTSKSYH